MCALFGSSRDISFIKKVNRELLDNVIQQEVDYYKYYLPETKGKDTDNVYGEASAQKTYYTATRLTCLLTRGDIVEVRGAYYEIDQINENQFVLGRDGDYGKSVGSEFGESLSIICVAHYTRVTRLQIVKSRY